MTTSWEKDNLCGHINEFYNGKYILLTGASGLFGAVLLEVLLRCCPGIQAIYLLIREKKGVTPEKRKTAIFNKSIFDPLKSTKPDVLDKVHVIPGDVSLPDLGMNKEDMFNVCQNVSVVFHLAACVHFMKSYRYILSQNSLGTSYVVDLCRKLKRLDALIYTSTASVASNRRKVIKEIVYRLPFPSQWFLEELKNGTEESLESLIAECQPKWPNTYTFSKALSENVLQDNALDMPIGIIRTSVIGCTVRKPYQGYMEEGFGIMALFIGIAKGYIRVYHTSQDQVFDIVPADVCANAHIIAAWTLATRRIKSPLVMNVVSYGSYEVKIAEANDAIVSHVTEHPLKNSFQTPVKMAFIKNSILYWMIAAYEHYASGYVMDYILKLNGKKPGLVKMYTFLDTFASAMQYFFNCTWCFETQNFNKLSEHLDDADKMTFNISLSGFDPYAVICESFRKLDGSSWKGEEEIRKYRSELDRRKMTTTFIKNGVLIYICLFLSFITFYLIPTIFSLY